MKINGSLVFDASSASQIENLRLQKVTAVPGILDSDVGRLIYNTNTNTIHVGTNVGNVLSWVPLATGGDASALLAEVDRLETALGLNTDGSFNASAFTGNLAGQTSYAGLITRLQNLLGTVTDDLAAEVTARGTAITGVTTAINNEVTARTDAMAAETTRVDAALAGEVTRATGIEGGLRTDVTAVTGRVTTVETGLAAEVTRATTAETGLRTDVDAATGNIAAEVTRATAAEGVNTAAIGAEVTRATAAEGVNAAAIAAELGRAQGAESALDGRITTEVTDRTAAVAAVAANLATEISDRNTAVTAVTTALGQEVTRATADAAAIRGELASALVGLSWEAPVDLIATNADATGHPDGFRIVDTTARVIYTVTGGALGTGEPLVDGSAFFNRTNDIGYTFNGTTVVPFSGAASFAAGAGLSMSGNTVNVGNTDGSITITEDDISVSEAVRSEITDNAAAIAAETTRATGAEDGLTQSVANEVAAREAAVLAEEDRATAAEEAIAADLAAEVINRGTAEAGLQTSINNVATAATGLVTTERNRAVAREDAIAADLATEVTARGTAITNAINDEVTARDAAIGTAVGTEATARDAAIAAEATARTAAATAEAARVDAAAAADRAIVRKMYFLYDGAPSATHTVTHNLGQRYCNVTVVDADDNVVIPESIVFTGANALTVTFNTAIACRVVVMGLAAAA